MISRVLSLLALTCAASMPVAAAQDAITTSSVNVRAGPSGSMPTVTWLLGRTTVSVVGCLPNWSWCDVIAGRDRGWIYSRYLSVPFNGTAVTILNGGPNLGLPVVEFAVGPYWDAHHQRKAWFGQKASWEQRWAQQRPLREWRDPTAPRSTP
jgi:uncharacterized protein YraI